ncbi:hypothetical protein CaCOL14_008346 [Colletotrichum acutatum]
MEASGVNSKRPACDNCKGRKTKCDRETPCSSCVASNLTCRLTHRSSERRQRVLISPRYDEAIESVDRSLKEVSQAVQQLLEINQQKSHSSPLVSPPSFIGNHSPNFPGLSEGYRGDSSFKAHVHRVTDALKDVAADLESTLGDDSALSATMQMIDQATGSEERSPTQTGSSLLSVQAQLPELGSRSLPSTDRVLKLVRLCQAEKQRFFIDVPVIDEREFGEFCQKVCFAITDFSTVDWIIVNAGLFFLLQGLKPHHYAIVNITDLYSGFFEYAVIVGDMHVELFSASALRQPLETRSQNAKLVVAKLLEVNTRIKQSAEYSPSDDDLHKALATLLDFMMYGLVAIAYRVIPCDEASYSPLKCSNECTEAARDALRTIVGAFESWGHLRITGWSMLLNMMLSLVPFACFVVLAGYTVTTASEEDLTLLCSTISAIEPTSSSSPSAKKLYDVCKAFYELASFSVKRRSLTSKGPQHAEQAYGERELEDIPSLPEVNFAPPPYDHIMAPQDWDAVMNEFDLVTEASAMASFVEPYIPFDGRLP